MSRRRLARGYYKGRQVAPTDREHNRVYLWCSERGRYYHRFSVVISYEWPHPSWFELDHRLPRKTLKALWKAVNGRPTEQVLTSRPALIHSGGKPVR